MVGAGCLLHDVDLPPGVVVPPGVFMHSIPLGPEAGVGAGIPLPAAAAGESEGHGLTLVHFSAQPEPFLTQNAPYMPPDTPQQPLNAPQSHRKRLS
jgi:hypothetical protein